MNTEPRFLLPAGSKVTVQSVIHSGPIREHITKTALGFDRYEAIDAQRRYVFVHLGWRIYASQSQVVIGQAERERLGRVKQLRSPKALGRQRC
jgi:hypothetical protein